MWQLEWHKGTLTLDAGFSSTPALLPPCCLCRSSSCSGRCSGVFMLCACDVLWLEAVAVLLIPGRPLATRHGCVSESGSTHEGQKERKSWDIWEHRRPWDSWGGWSESRKGHSQECSRTYIAHSLGWLLSCKKPAGQLYGAFLKSHLSQVREFQQSEDHLQAATIAVPLNGL